MMNTNEMPIDAWQALSDKDRQVLTLLARQRIGFETLEERGRDRLDFKEVAVWCVRDALARAFLAGAKAKN